MRDEGHPARVAAELPGPLAGEPDRAGDIGERRWVAAAIRGRGAVVGREHHGAPAGHDPGQVPEVAAVAGREGSAGDHDDDGLPGSHAGRAKESTYSRQVTSFPQGMGFVTWMSRVMTTFADRQVGSASPHGGGGGGAGVAGSVGVGGSGVGESAGGAGARGLRWARMRRRRRLGRARGLDARARASRRARARARQSLRRDGCEWLIRAPLRVVVGG